MSLKDKYQVTNVFVSAVTPENISRQQLLAWVNDSLQSNLTKIEEMSTGAAYCMLTDRLFPGSIPLRKVKWNSKSDVDYLANWKIVQNAWHELGITKPIQVQTLMKGKFQDNFEFLQWFKRFYDHNDANYEYDPLEARNHEPFPTSTGIRSTKAPAARVPIASSTTAARRTTMAPTSNKTAAPVPVSATRKSMAPRPATTTTNNTKSNLSVQQEAKYRAEISDLKDQISTWEKTLSSVEQERDYYYAKLHKLELLCNDSDAEQDIKVSRILSILYKEEDDGTDLQDFEATEEKILHGEDVPNAVEEDHKDVLDSTFVKHPEIESNGDVVEEKGQKEDQLIDLSDVQEKEQEEEKEKETDLNGTFVKEKQPDVEHNEKEEF